MRTWLGVVVAGISLSAAIPVWAEPAGLTVWSGKGASAQGGHMTPAFTHLSAMHFSNGRTVYTTMGPGTLYGLGGTPPGKHGRDYFFHVDQVYVGKDSYPADGRCEVKLRADGTLRSVGCAAAAGGPDPSLHFDADRTPPDFKSFGSDQLITPAR